MGRNQQTCKFLFKTGINKMKDKTTDIKICDMVLVSKRYAETCVHGETKKWLLEQAKTPTKVTGIGKDEVSLEDTTKSPFSAFNWCLPKNAVKLYVPKAKAKWQPKDGDKVWIVSRSANVRPSVYNCEMHSWGLRAGWLKRTRKESRELAKELKEVLKKHNVK
jgi:hypothetical protein